MFYVKKFKLFNSFFIGLIYFIFQQINNHLRQFVYFIFLPFFLDFFFFFFVVNQIKENKFFFCFPLNFPWITKQVKKIIFISLVFTFLPFSSQFSFSRIFREPNIALIFLDLKYQLLFKIHVLYLEDSRGFLLPSSVSTTELMNSALLV